jgi:hypothetical protein
VVVLRARAVRMGASTTLAKDSTVEARTCNRRENTAKQRVAQRAPSKHGWVHLEPRHQEKHHRPQSARKFSVTPGCTNPRTCGPMGRRCQSPAPRPAAADAAIRAAIAIGTATAIRLVMLTSSKRVLSRCGRSQRIQRRGRIQQDRLVACRRCLLFQRSICASMTPVRTADFSAA